MTTSNDELNYGICKLCLCEAPLRKSHIIPEWAYKPMYDEKHRFLVLRSDIPQSRVFEQKGLREKLLCDTCELLISKHENYTRQLIYASNLSDSVGVGFIREGTKIKVHGVEYRSLKLFQLSILWRAAVSKLQFFENVDLGPHEEKVRRLLLNEDPGESHDYGCMMATHQDENLDSIYVFTKPAKGKFGGMRGYRFEFS